MPIVVRLGAFRTLMNYLGSVGKIMKDSGLEELFEEVYAPNSIPHIISGKAYSRSVRAHTLAQSALVNLLLEKVTSDCGTNINFMKNLCEKVMTDDLSTEDINEVTSSSLYIDLRVRLKTLKESLNSLEWQINTCVFAIIIVVVTFLVL